MQLVIVSPEKKVLEEECVSITLPTTEGQITILPNHIPLFALLSPGEVIVRQKDGIETNLIVGSGFVNFSQNRLILLANFGVQSDQINEEEIKAARARAEEILANKTDAAVMAEAQANLARSILQLKMVKKHKRNLSWQLFIC